MVKISALQNATYSVVFLLSSYEKQFLEKKKQQSWSERTELHEEEDEEKRKKRLASDHWLLEISVHFYSALEEMASREDVPSNN